MAIGWLLLMSIIFFFASPKLTDKNLNVALVLSGISCMASYSYTFLKSRSISPRTRDELLSLLRDGADPCSLCPNCNIV